MLQIVALLLGCLAFAWGLFCVYGAAFPGPCGDNGGPGLGVLEAWAVDVPLGLMALGVGALVKRGYAGLRRACLVVALVTLPLPAIAQSFLSHWKCS